MLLEKGWLNCAAASPPLSSNLFPCAALMQEPQCSPVQTRRGFRGSSGLPSEGGGGPQLPAPSGCRPHLAAGPGL